MMEPTVSPACRELIAQLSAWLDGELEAGLCASIECHLAVCPDCRALANTMQQTLALYRRAPRETVPRSAHARLVALCQCK